jgi:MoaA/NifB/PqqE/SkfB family radical SAM enzyme
MSLNLVKRLAREFSDLGTRYVLLSGGEPLQHSAWAKIAAEFKTIGAKVGMATSGILLSRNAGAVGEFLDEIYVSLDGATPESYMSIRGVQAFDLIRQGVEKIAGRLPVTFRTTVQRANYPELPELISLSRSWGAAHHSFLAVDVNTHAAFGRSGFFDRSLALGVQDLDPFADVIERVIREFGDEIRRGFVPESASKLRNLHAYFSALLGLKPFPPVRCNAPTFSAVVETDGAIKPCFFLPISGRVGDGPVRDSLNTEEGKSLRREQRTGHREECTRCVCPSFKGLRTLWREF